MDVSDFLAATWYPGCGRKRCLDQICVNTHLSGQLVLKMALCRGHRDGHWHAVAAGAVLCKSQPLLVLKAVRGQSMVTIIGGGGSHREI